MNRSPEQALLEHKPLENRALHPSEELIIESGRYPPKALYFGHLPRSRPVPLVSRWNTFRWESSPCARSLDPLEKARVFGMTSLLSAFLICKTWDGHHASFVHSEPVAASACGARDVREPALSTAEGNLLLGCGGYSSMHLAAVCGKFHSHYCPSDSL